MEKKLVFDEKTVRIALFNLGEFLKQKSQTDVLPQKFPVAHYCHMFAGAKTDQTLHFLNFAFVTTDKLKLDMVATELKEYIERILKTEGHLTTETEGFKASVP